MRLIEFTVFNSKLPIAINPDTVIRVGTMGMPPDHSFIKFVDGGSVDVAESYEQVRDKLRSESA